MKFIFKSIVVMAILVVLLLGALEVKHYYDVKNIPDLPIPESNVVDDIYITKSENRKFEIPEDKEEYVLNHMYNFNRYDTCETDWVYGAYDFLIKIEVDGAITTYYLYEKDGKALIEQPYYGVYEVEYELYEYFMSFYE